MITELMKNNNVEKLICSSGGNAGLAVATAGKKVSLPVDVYVPVTTKDMMVTKLRNTGANVIVHGKNWNEADLLAREALEKEAGAFYIPPYDDPLIWEGNASIVDEIADEGIKPGAIILSVGGGGLLCGVQRGLEKHGWQDVRIIAAETEGAASFAAAQKAGKPVPIPAITSIATSLGALAVTSGTLTTADTISTVSMVVTDEEAVRALRRFADEERVLVEPACGAALAGIYETERLERILSQLGDNKTIVVIVCGGSAISLDLMRTWSEQFGVV